MTTQQVVWMTLAYLVAFVAVAYFTRATRRRVLGALLGGAVVGAMLLGVIELGNALQWWRVPLGSRPSFPALLYVGGAISCSPIYLVTWRVARRYGGRGLAVCLLMAAIFGPPRDYLFAAIYPEWIVFAPGVTPVLAVSATYVALVALGHGVMRLAAGPARLDSLAARPWRRRAA
jgi:hypothetical protein